MRLIDADELLLSAYWHGDPPTQNDPYGDGVDAVDVSDIEAAPTIKIKLAKGGTEIEFVREDR